MYKGHVIVISERKEENKKHTYRGMGATLCESVRANWAVWHIRGGCTCRGLVIIEWLVNKTKKKKTN